MGKILQFFHDSFVCVTKIVNNNNFKKDVDLLLGELCVTVFHRSADWPYVQCCKSSSANCSNVSFTDSYSGGGGSGSDTSQTMMWVAFHGASTPSSPTPPTPPPHPSLYCYNHRSGNLSLTAAAPTWQLSHWIFRQPQRSAGLQPTIISFEIIAMPDSRQIKACLFFLSWMK